MQEVKKKKKKLLSWLPHGKDSSAHVLVFSCASTSKGQLGLSACMAHIMFTLAMEQHRQSGELTATECVFMVSIKGKGTIIS
jgi:hypothetical protein